MIMRRGLVITERASCSTAAGIVAEKSALCRCFEVHAARISSVCSSNPSSKSLSASSRTRYSTLLVNLPKIKMKKEMEEEGLLVKFKGFFGYAMD
jgi:hypothetical protein